VNAVIKYIIYLRPINYRIESTINVYLTKGYTLDICDLLAVKIFAQKYFIHFKKYRLIAVNIFTKAKLSYL